MKKLCNHPLLVYKNHTYLIDEYLQRHNSALEEIDHSAKLLALKELLSECGIGINDIEEEEEEELSQHRALIFCQQKSMLDIIESMLFSKHMKSLSYLRIDGSVPAMKRQEIVTRYNEDPSIDVLLLTTNVGGLGLNLSTADTVIFVEHDYNPSKDMQAMDRAHRIGQKNTVNVYRLITKDTLEEKIMSLQRFKQKMTNTIINEENSGIGLQSLKGDEIMSVFETNTARSTNKRGHDKDDEMTSKKIKSLGVGVSNEVMKHLDGLVNSYEEDYEN